MYVIPHHNTFPADFQCRAGRSSEEWSVAGAVCGHSLASSMGWCNGAAAAAAAGAALCPSKLHAAFLLHTTQPQLSSTCHHVSKAGGGAVLEIEAARKNQSGVRLQQSKRWKTDESGKKIGHAGIENFRNSLDTIQNKTDTAGGNAAAALLLLREDQALGQVMAAQANFMRVFIERAWEADAAAPDAVVAAERNGKLASSKLDCAQENAQEENGNGVEARQGTELLCVVRALLKKIKRRVLVGDRVLVSGIDWIDRRGMVEDVLDRHSEIAEPPVANVEHLLVLFSLDRPKLDPLALSRFLVEAESTGIPFTLVLNKADLVQPEVRITITIIIIIIISVSWQLCLSFPFLSFLSCGLVLGREV